MFDKLTGFFKRMNVKEIEDSNAKKENAKDAKERLHLVLLQDRANVSADFLDLMKQEIIEVIKKYIDVDEDQIDVKLTNKVNSDGTTGAPALYANIPIVKIKSEARKAVKKQKDAEKQAQKETDKKTETEKTSADKKTEPVKNEVSKETIKKIAKKSATKSTAKVATKEAKKPATKATTKKTATKKSTKTAATKKSTAAKTTAKKSTTKKTASTK